MKKLYAILLVIAGLFVLHASQVSAMNLWGVEVPVDSGLSRPDVVFLRGISTVSSAISNAGKIATILFKIKDPVVRDEIIQAFKEVFSLGAQYFTRGPIAEVAAATSDAIAAGAATAAEQAAQLASGALAEQVASGAFAGQVASDVGANISEGAVQTVAETGGRFARYVPSIVQRGGSALYSGASNLYGTVAGSAKDMAQAARNMSIADLTNYVSQQTNKAIQLAKENPKAAALIIATVIAVSGVLVWKLRNAKPVEIQVAKMNAQQEATVVQQATKDVIEMLNRTEDGKVIKSSLSDKLNLTVHDIVTISDTILNDSTGGQQSATLPGKSIFVNYRLYRSQDLKKIESIVINGETIQTGGVNGSEILNVKKGRLGQEYTSDEQKNVYYMTLINLTMFIIEQITSEKTVTALEEIQTKQKQQAEMQTMSTAEVPVTKTSASPGQPSRWSRMRQYIPGLRGEQQVPTQ